MAPMGICRYWLRSFRIEAAEWCVAMPDPRFAGRPRLSGCAFGGRDHQLTVTVELQPNALAACFLCSHEMCAQPVVDLIVESSNTELAQLVAALHGFEDQLRVHIVKLQPV